MEPNDHALDAMRYSYGIFDELFKQSRVTRDPGQKVKGINYFVQTDKVRAMSIDAQVASVIKERRQKVQLEQKLALVEQYGDDGVENGTVLHFFKRYNADMARDLPAGTYEFVALKVADKWFLTGSLMGFTRGTWDQFVLALVSGDYPIAPDDIEVLSTTNSHPFKYANDNEVAQNYEQEKQEWPLIAETQVIPKHVGIYPANTDMNYLD